MIDPYLPFLRETLAKFPRLTASRLYLMVRERGYPGGPNHFRHLIGLNRPRPRAEAYLRLRTLPAEQMQCDWAHFGHLTIGLARRPIMAFVMVLSYSRQIFLRFYLDARMGSFLRGHVEAFAAWGGLARVCLYDNLLCGAPHKRFYVSTAIMWSKSPAALWFVDRRDESLHIMASASGSEGFKPSDDIPVTVQNLF